jgi:sarcosine oxidase subunit beta
VEKFEVGIVGAGVHGASAAFHLASRGISTVVFEKEGPAQGPTGRSSAICRAYYTNPFLARMARDSIQMLERFVDMTGTDAGFRRTGFLFLHPPEDLQRVRNVVERLNQLGVATSILDCHELALRFPLLDQTGIGFGVWERDAGYADPSSTTTGLLRRATALGARFLRRDVVSIETRWPTIVTADGARTRCSRVLIAAGPWTRHLAWQAGVDIPLSVERHIVAVLGLGRAKPVPAHADLTGGYYLRPDGPEGFLVGSLYPGQEVDPDHFAQTVGVDEILALSRPVAARFPHLRAAEVRGGWASLYDVSPDWQPVIGEIAPRVFVDAGTSGHGFKLAPALGEHVADLVLGEEGEGALAEFHPFRFERGRMMGAGYGEARILG